jgi:hypothetical protein
MPYAQLLTRAADNVIDDLLERMRGGTNDEVGAAVPLNIIMTEKND